MLSTHRIRRNVTWKLKSVSVAIKAKDWMSSFFYIISVDDWIVIIRLRWRKWIHTELKIRFYPILIRQRISFSDWYFLSTLGLNSVFFDFLKVLYNIIAKILISRVCTIAFLEKWKDIKSADEIFAHWSRHKGTTRKKWGKFSFPFERKPRKPSNEKDNSKSCFWEQKVSHLLYSVQTKLK
jgi:hypothetical protein